MTGNGVSTHEPEMTAVGEFAVHRWIADGLLAAASSDAIAVGVGDDGAVVRVDPAEDVVVSTDSVPPALLDTDDLESARYAARFAVVSSLSDIIAMGGEPVGVLLNLHVRRATAAAWARELLTAADVEAARFGAAVIGGDLKERAADSLTTTAVGRVARGHVLRRDGARVGDAVALTVSAGADGVVNGLGTRWAHELAARLPESARTAAAPLVDRNAKFNDLGLAVEAMREVTRRGLATSAIDTSDGLLACAQLVGEASGVGIEIDVVALERLVNPDVRRVATALGIPAFLFAMNAGHDWEVMVTVRPERVGEFEAFARPEEPPAVALIGRAVPRADWARRGVRLVAERGEVVVLPYFTDEKFVAHPYEQRPESWLDFARAVASRLGVR